MNFLPCLFGKSPNCKCLVNFANTNIPAPVTHSDPPLNLIHTATGFFSYSQKVHRSSQRSLFSGTMAKSNAQTSLAKIRRIPAHARFCPRQLRGPRLKGGTVWRLSLKKGDFESMAASESHRSGAKAVARWKLAGSRFIL